MSRNCFGNWKQRRAQLVTVLEQEYQLKSWDYRRQLAMPAELVGKPRLGVIRRCKHLGEPSTYTGSFRVHLPTTGLNTSYSGLKKSVQSAVRYTMSGGSTHLHRNIGNLCMTNKSGVHRHMPRILTRRISQCQASPERYFGTSLLSLSSSESPNVSNPAKQPQERNVCKTTGLGCCRPRWSEIKSMMKCICSFGELLAILGPQNLSLFDPTSKTVDYVPYT